MDFDSGDGKTRVEHLGGVSWHAAPRPRRWHRCKAQTRGITNYFTDVERCACGAVRVHGRHWMERNSR